MRVSTDYPYQFTGFGRTVHIAENVWQAWQQHRQIKTHMPESFGTLIGISSEDRKQVWIEHVTTPAKLDEQSRSFFKLNDRSHQGHVDDAHTLSYGTQIYLGTWHTHPQKIPHPSNVDLNDWKGCLKRNSKRPLVFAIVGTMEMKIFVKRGVGFKALRVGGENKNDK